MTLVSIQPTATDIWTAAGVLLGFQVTSFIWRIDREVKIRDAAQRRLHPEPWLTPSDFVNIISMIVVVVGVFVLPILGLANSTFLKDSFGLAALLFIGHAFARAGHYEMYTRPLYALRDRLQKILGKTKKDSTSDQSAVPDSDQSAVPKYYPRQERVVVRIIIMMVIAYVIIAIIKR